MKLLFISLSSYETLNRGIYKSIIDTFSKNFEELVVFCLDKKKKIVSNNVTYCCGDIFDWFRYFKLKKEGIEFVYISDFFVGGLMGVFFSKILKKPLVLRCGSPWRYKIDSLSKFFKTVLTWIIKPIVIKSCKKVAYNSKSVVQNRLKHDYAVIYNGVDLDLFKPIKMGEVSKKFNVLFIGRVLREKGLDYLFRAISETRDEVNLGVVGTGPLLKYYKRKFGFAKYYGKVSHLKLPYLINKYDVIILPSLTNSSESFPNVLLEAMACGKPVIGTKVWGIPEMIDHGKNGVLINEKNSREIKDSVLFLKNNERRREEMGLEGRRKVEKMFEKGTQLRKLYNCLFDSRYLK